MSFFNNKVVIVTGGTDGIGRALIGLLIEAGCQSGNLRETTR